MDVTELASDTHERVLRVCAPECGLLAFIAIHSSVAGPAAGGLRFHPFLNEREALADVLRLSRGMTFKNAAAGLPLGGGKAVIVGDPARDKSPDLLRAFGRAVDRLGGRYWTAEDMGVGPADMEIIAEVTPYVVGRASGALASGDPSPVTARGVLGALGVVARHAFGRDDLDGLRCAVQGLGHVGAAVADGLAGAGARLIVTDIDAGRVARAVRDLGAVAVAPEAIAAARADILIPCAMGGILNRDSVPALRVRAVCGAANNQLDRPEDGAALHRRGILYAPDYVVNAGGIINVATEILRITDRDAFVRRHLAAQREMLDRILTEARERGVPPETLADGLVAERMRAAAA